MQNPDGFPEMDSPVGDEYARKYHPDIAPPATTDMLMTPTVGKVALALAKAQGAFKHPPKDREVVVRTKDGRSYQFKYATLDAVMSAVRAPLAAEGLALVQLIVPVQGRHKLRTMLIHSSGEYIGSEVPLLVSGNASNQEFGSALTYMRRYTLSALLGIVADEDDDANAADGNSAQQVAKPTGQQRPAPAAKPAPAPAPQQAPKPAQAAPAAAPPPPAEPPAQEGGEPVLTRDEARDLYNRIKAEAQVAISKKDHDALGKVIAAHGRNLERIAEVGDDAKAGADALKQKIEDKLRELWDEAKQK